MPTPFPGMDPYLEQSDVWEEVHTALLVAIQRFLTPLLQPRYRVAIEKRVYLNFGQLKLIGDRPTGIPDVVISGVESPRQVSETAAPYAAEPQILVAEIPLLHEIHEIAERYLAIRKASGEREVVTVIELLSPSNKRRGQGLEEYLDKRDRVLATRAHLIEIDLIHAGDRMPMTIRDGKLLDYYILVSRAAHRPRADVYTFGLRQPIPAFPTPLLADDPEPLVPLNQLLHEVYDQAGYGLDIDYTQPCAPSLSPEDAAWANIILQPITQPPS